MRALSRELFCASGKTQHWAGDSPGLRAVLGAQRPAGCLDLHASLIFIFQQTRGMVFPMLNRSSFTRVISAENFQPFPVIRLEETIVLPS